MATLNPRMAAAAYRPGRRQALARALHRSGLVAGLTWARSAMVRDLRILAYHRVVTLDGARDFDFDLDLVSASEQQFREQMKAAQDDSAANYDEAVRALR